MIKTILVAVDTSDASREALNVALQLSAALGGRLVLLTVVDVSKLLAVAGYETPYPVDTIEIMRRDAETTLDECASLCAGKATVSVLTAEGEASDEILRAAESEKADLICIGTHGRKGISRLFLGSVAESVLRRAEIPVLVSNRKDT